MDNSNEKNWKPSPRIIGIICVIGLSIFCPGVQSVEAPLRNEEFDKVFHTFLHGSQYLGAVVGVMRRGKLLYAQGYGTTKDGYKITPEMLFSSSNISKALTAAAILKLVEDKKLNLTHKVFGPYGILNHLQPWSTFRTDSRLYEITVDDLLRHSAGWNPNVAPMFDPLLNEAYLSRGYRVPNISAIMKLKRKAQPKDILQYVMSLPLQYTPGTQSIHSSLGYVILAQIIEKKQDYDFENYIRQNILEPCGMWNTRMKKQHKGHNKKTKKEMVKRDAFEEFPPTQSLHMEAEVLAPTFGWYSNVYDIMRFMRCLDHSGDHHLLDESSMRILMEKPSLLKDDVETWMGAGFTVSKDGSVWQKNDIIVDDLLFYHKGLVPPVNGKLKSNDSSADSIVVLFVGQKTKSLSARLFFDFVKNWPQQSPDYFSHDLADVRVGEAGRNEHIVKFELHEDHISAYISAVREQDFKPNWISAYEHGRKTYFTVIARFNPGQNHDDFYFHHGLDEESLLNHKKLYFKKQTYLSLLQSYISLSFMDRHRYAAMFNKEMEEPVDIKYGIRQYSQCYKLFTHVYQEKGFIPRVQSFVHINQEPQVCFILEKKPIKDYKEYMDISLKDLHLNAATNAKAGRVMTYLDSSSRYKKPRFSAIFRKDSSKDGAFKSNIDMNKLEYLITGYYQNGKYFPKLMIAYATKDGNLQFGLYSERDI